MICLFQATTDLYGNCTLRHSGTSAAAPEAAGVFALALEAKYGVYSQFHTTITTVIIDFRWTAFVKHYRVISFHLSFVSKA